MTAHKTRPRAWMDLKVPRLVAVIAPIQVILAPQRSSYDSRTRSFQPFPQEIRDSYYRSINARTFLANSSLRPQLTCKTLSPPKKMCYFFETLSLRRVSSSWMSPSQKTWTSLMIRLQPSRASSVLSVKTFPPRQPWSSITRLSAWMQRASDARPPLTVDL
jgi:hypothetical protein